MFEDVARTVHIARQLGDAGTDRRRSTSTALFDRYQNVYGQAARRPQ